MSFGIEKQILRFDIPVSDALTVKIGNSLEHLLETTLHLTGAHASAKKTKALARRSMKGGE